MKKYWILLLLIFCMINAGYAKAEFEVTYFAEEVNRDTYYREVIQLALEKTQPKYGSFKLTVVPNVPTQRRFAFLQENTLPNAIVLRGYDNNFQSSGNLTYIDFPMDLGALSMRICFVSPQKKEKISKVKSLTELRQYSIVQGIGWADNAILRKNGFTVIELDSYLNLFKMVASGRADLFCRGFNELPDEYTANRAMGNLTYDESFLLRYKMPYFLFINKQNTLTKQRLEEGLKMAYEDGSIMQFWRKKYEKSIQFSNIKKRRIFNLENDTSEATSSEYDKYIINPLTLE